MPPFIKKKINKKWRNLNPISLEALRINPSVNRSYSPNRAIGLIMLEALTWNSEMVHLWSFARKWYPVVKLEHPLHNKPGSLLLMNFIEYKKKINSTGRFTSGKTVNMFKVFPKRSYLSWNTIRTRNKSLPFIHSYTWWCFAQITYNIFISILSSNRVGCKI